MSEPYLGYIGIFGFEFAPKGYAFCDGQILPINQNNALYSLIGTTYGGDGRTSFALPDLRGRVPLNISPEHHLGERGGSETQALTQSNLPAHNHTLKGSENPSDQSSPENNVHGVPGLNIYGQDTTKEVQLSQGSVSSAGNSAPHINMQPSLALNFCIAIKGLFPSRS